MVIVTAVNLANRQSKRRCRLILKFLDGKTIQHYFTNSMFVCVEDVIIRSVVGIFDGGLKFSPMIHRIVLFFTYRVVGQVLSFHV